MTRTTVMSGVHGMTEVILPGKEGIAVLAQKTVDNIFNDEVTKYVLTK